MLLGFFFAVACIGHSTSTLQAIERGEGRSESHYKKLQSLVAQLRKVCNHPYLFDTAEDMKSLDPLGAMVASLGNMSYWTNKFKHVTVSHSISMAPARGHRHTAKLGYQQITCLRKPPRFAKQLLSVF